MDTYQFADTTRSGALLFAGGSQTKGMGMVLPWEPGSKTAAAVTESGGLALPRHSAPLNRNSTYERCTIDRFDDTTHRSHRLINGPSPVRD